MNIQHVHELIKQHTPCLDLFIRGLGRLFTVHVVYIKIPAICMCICGVPLIMKCVAVHTVLLLLCLSGPWAQAETDTVETSVLQTSSTGPDLWSELKDLKNMMVVTLGNTVVEQKVELRYMELEARLKKSETKVEQLEKDKAGICTHKHIIILL